MPLDASLKVTLGSNLTAAADLSNANSILSLALNLNYTDGSGANQVTKRFDDLRVVAPSATDSLDVNAGGLVDQFGVAFTLTKLKMILVISSDATVNLGANQLQITRPASNGVPFLGAASDFVVLNPGGIFLWGDPGAAGITVTAATGDLINLVNSAGTNSITYRIVLLGA